MRAAMESDQMATESDQLATESDRVRRTATATFPTRVASGWTERGRRYAVVREWLGRQMKAGAGVWSGRREAQRPRAEGLGTFRRSAA